MRKSICGAVVALGLTAMIAGAAEAQVEGLPVYNGGIGTGLVLSADAGIPNSDLGKGLALGLSGRLGLGPLGFSATVARHDPKGPADAITSVGATANYKVFGGPLVPFSVTLQGGAGYWTIADATPSGDDIKMWHFPVGLGLAMSIPNPAFAIRPWIAPRLDVRHASVGDASDTETDFGVSVGIDLNTISGFGLHAAYDRVFGDPADPAVIALGVHYSLRLPGL